MAGTPLLGPNPGRNQFSNYSSFPSDEESPLLTVPLISEQQQLISDPLSEQQIVSNTSPTSLALGITLAIASLAALIILIYVLVRGELHVSQAYH